jgi:hypothetical protein
MTAATRALAAAPPLLLVQAGTSTTNPIVTLDIFNHVYLFTGAHRRLATLALRAARPMLPGRRRDEAAWGRNNALTRIKVACAAWLCRCGSSHCLPAACMHEY